MKKGRKDITIGILDYLITGNWPSISLFTMDIVAWVSFYSTTPHLYNLIWVHLILAPFNTALTKENDARRGTSSRASRGVN